jgi:hypothetical protein
MRQAFIMRLTATLLIHPCQGLESECSIEAQIPFKSGQVSAILNGGVLAELIRHLNDCNARRLPTPVNGLTYEHLNINSLKVQNQPTN